MIPVRQRFPPFQRYDHLLSIARYGLYALSKKLFAYQQRWRAKMI